MHLYINESKTGIVVFYHHAGICDCKKSNTPMGKYSSSNPHMSVIMGSRDPSDRPICDFADRSGVDEVGKVL